MRGVYLRIEQFADVSVVLPVVHFNAHPTELTSLLPAGISRSHAVRKFNSLYDVIEDLTNLPANRDDAVDEDTARDAANVLSMIQQYNLPAPTIFSHGGDSIVFNWDFRDTSRYMTISDSAMAVLDVHRKSHVKCPYPIVDLDAPQLEKWLQLSNLPLKE